MFVFGIILAKGLRHVASALEELLLWRKQCTFAQLIIFGVLELIHRYNCLRQWYVLIHGFNSLCL